MDVRIPALVVITVSVLAARAADDDQDRYLLERFDQLQHDIPSLYLINGLHLSREQAADLSRLMEKAETVAKRIDRRIQLAMRSHARDLDQQKEEIISMVGRGGEVDMRKLHLSPRSDRMRLAQSRINDVRRERHESMDELADKTYGLLTLSQRKIVDSFVPCFIPARGFSNADRVGRGTGDTTPVEKALAQLRSAREGRKEQAIEKALARLVPYTMKNRRLAYSVVAEEDVREELMFRLEPLFDRLRDMDDADFKRDRGNMVKELVPVDPYKDDPRLLRWKIRRYLLNTGVEDVVSARGDRRTTAKPGRTSTAFAPGEQRTNADLPKQAREDLMAARLLAGLQVGREQASNILEIVEHALETREKIGERSRLAISKGVSACEELRVELASGMPSSRAESLATRSYDRARGILDGGVTAAMLEHEAELDSVLTATQVAFLQGEPRAGPESRKRSAKKSEKKRYDLSYASRKTMDRAARVVSEARRLSAASFFKRKEELSRDFLVWCVNENSLDPDGISTNREVERAVIVLERAREMSFPDYRSARKYLAIELCPRRTEPREPAPENRYFRGNSEPAVNPTTLLLLTRTSARILEKLSR
ncbi:MAG: hypothetical protein HQ559_07390 [Lentisphaerae bacterium]|nr:hypothetical protein [Lentisphaerota bacterium]